MTLLQSPQEVELASALWGLFGGLAGTALGYLGALSAFKSKIEVAETKFADFKEEREKFSNRIEQQLRESEHRQNTALTELRGEYRNRCDSSDRATQKLADKVDKLISATERRQILILQLLADLAKAQGLTHRATDILPRAMGGLEDDS